jgi:hypothetical protein
MSWPDGVVVAGLQQATPIAIASVAHSAKNRGNLASPVAVLERPDVSDASRAPPA